MYISFHVTMALVHDVYDGIVEYKIILYMFFMSFPISCTNIVPYI
jgi:hypothetical protein